MNLRTLIADDEPLARERLRHLLAAHPEVEIVAECRNGREAVAALKAHPIDLAFLDIQMPGNSGFEVLREIGPAHMPLTVFVTAYNSYAVQAFEVHAIDYLTKPVEPERLAAALAHVQNQLDAKTALTVQVQLKHLLENFPQQPAERKQFPQRILVPDRAKDSFVVVNEIEWIEAADYYVQLHVGSKTLALRQSIKQLAGSLDPKRFVRVHRSAIVNVSYVREILRDGHTDGWVVLSTGQRLRMSKAGWQNLLAATTL
ncbi:MAG TPA: LytTR family DNA-binding domain-containing protein [Acidobacteriaceae bacterium]|nr:LytTR family DNA-binding domain-containing protein [Acidobacteriaceae bacterium]